jgi:hypothetical protein
MPTINIDGKGQVCVYNVYDQFMGSGRFENLGVRSYFEGTGQR